MVCLISLGCKNIAYNKVSSDTQISARNKKLLLGICDRQFPQLPPTVIEGKTIIKTDTFSVTDTFTTTVNNEVIKFVYKTNTVTVDRFKTDTVIKTNTYQLTACNDEKRVLEKEVDKLHNAKDVDTAKIKSLRIKFWALIAGNVLLLLGFLTFVYLKAKSKLI